MLLLAALLACAPNDARPTAAGTVEPPGRSFGNEVDPTRAALMPERIYAIEGVPLVIPVSSPYSIPSPITTEDGRTLSARLFLVTREPLTLDPLSWLEPAGGWDATELTPGQPVLQDNGLWMLLVNLPEGYSNRPLFAGDRQLPVLWLPEPPASTESRFLPRLNASPSAWRELGEILTPVRNDPSQRWRVRLLTDRVRADRLFGVGGAAFNEKPIENELLEALARQTEMRYRVAIARMQLADPKAAAQLLGVLTTVVAMPDGQLLPAWADITPRLSTIVDAAINTARSPARAAEAMRAFADSLSPVRGWVIDDASSHRDGRAQTTMGIANLSIEALRASAGAAEQAFTRSADIPPHSAATVRAPIVIDPPRTPTDPPLVRPIDLRIETPRERHPLLTPGLGFGPPGQQLAPTLLPWTRSSWLGQRPVAAPTDRQTAALIQQSPATGAWELYIECNTPASAIESPPVNDLVRVWLGPFGRAEGYLVCGPGAGSQLTGATAPDVRFHDWGWASIVPIPARVIGEDGTLHIAVERIDEQGYRSTWPRPVLPDQPEPGRATFTLTPWSAALSGGD